jgi:hypothetical protein
MSQEIEQILESTPIEDSPQETVVQLSFEEILPILSNKYLELVKKIQEKLKYHHDLSGAFEAGIRNFEERMKENHDQVLYNLADNFLYCLEAICDKNSDFFMYQVDKIKKKNGKVEKVKVSRLIGKAQMKIILKECDDETKNTIFTEIKECFQLLTTKNENEDIVFFPQFVEFVKENLHDSKNFSKMLVSIDYIENMMQEVEESTDVPEMNLDSDSEDEKDKSKKSKKKTKGSGGMEDMFMKGLENTKIAQLAKNITEKMNPDDFPMLNDPTKLLSSMNEEGGGGLGNLLKFVVGEVSEALSQEGMSENDLVDEATNLMGNLKGMGGFDPFQMFKQMAESGAMGGGQGAGQMPDMNQFAGIFEGLNATLGEEMKKAVEETEGKKGKKSGKKK